MVLLSMLNSCHCFKGLVISGLLFDVGTYSLNFGFFCCCWDSSFFFGFELNLCIINRGDLELVLYLLPCDLFDMEYGVSFLSL